MVNGYCDYLKFIDDALELAKKVPKYFSRFSNRIYCNHQKLAVLILMQKFKTTTRGIVSILRASSDMRMHLGLHRVPVHTTIIRFAKKIGRKITNLLGIRQAINVGVDASGFELESKSYYYRNLWNSDKKQKTRRYMKLSLSVDLDKLVILKHKIRKKFRNDHIDFIPTLKNLKLKKVFADKGYDSKKNRQFVINKLKAIPIIPIRRHTNFYGYLYKHKKINGKDYHQRSKAETVFSMIKRKYGSVLRNKTCTTQKIELISKLIAHNIDRKQHQILLILRGLHQR